MRMTPASMRRLLRSPRLIVAEIAGITLGGLVMAIVPQEGGARPGMSGALVSALALDRVARSPWFLGLLILALASLFVVLIDQTKRAWLLSKRRPILAAAAPAPYRREALFATCPADLPASEYRVRGSLGHWGSPLFHAGVLVVIVAGLLRLLFGADAVVDLLVGETLVSRSVYDVQRPGLLGSPFAFPQDFRLDDLRVERYPSGDMKSVEATVSVGEGSHAARRSMAINDPTRSGIHTLYITTRGGPAVLMEIANAGASERHAILLRDAAAGSEGSIWLAGRMQLRVSSDSAGLGSAPGRVEVRAARDGALLAIAQLTPGESVTFPSGLRISVAGFVPWVQISGQRDLSTPVVYFGFLLACLGGLLMVAVVPVETVVAREKVAGGMRLTVVMRPRKFAPLFAPAFEDLWRRSTEGRDSVELECRDECA